MVGQVFHRITKDKVVVNNLVKVLKYNNSGNNSMHRRPWEVLLGKCMEDRVVWVIHLLPFRWTESVWSLENHQTT